MGKKSLVYGVVSLIVLIIGIVTVGQINAPSNQIFITGLSPITHQIGDEQPDLNEGITIKNGHGKVIIIPYVIDVEQVNWNYVGTYKVFYTYRNLNYSRTIIVNGEKPFFSSSTSLRFPINQTSADFSEFVQAYDLYGHDISDRIVFDDGWIDYKRPGLYNLVVSVSDDYGLTSTQGLLVEYYYDEHTDYYPKIHIMDSLVYYMGDMTKFYQTEIKGTDYFQQDISTLIVIDDKFVDYNATGIYPIYIHLVDNYGFSVDIQTELEVRMRDSEQTIRFEGLKQFIIKLGDVIPDYLLDVRALDDIEGDISYKIIVDDYDIDYSKIGNYTLYYSVTNLQGVTLNAIVQVYLIPDEYDSDKPIITGLNDLVYYMSQTKPDLYSGVLAYDLVSGNVTNRIQLTTENVNWNFPGVYPIIYEVQDDSVNKTVQTRYITIIDDVPPVFYGIINVYIDVNSSTYPDLIQHVSAYDNVDLDITAWIVVDDSSVDITKIGTYEIMYTISDSRNNITQQIAYVIVH